MAPLRANLLGASLSVCHALFFRSVVRMKLSFSNYPHFTFQSFPRDSGKNSPHGLTYNRGVFSPHMVDFAGLPPIGGFITQS